MSAADFSKAAARLPERALVSEKRLAALLSVLNDATEETRIVGGAVRDAMLGRPVNDVDLATTATPQVVTQRATACGFHVIPTGLEHGTVTVVVEGRPFEVTTLREDVETFGRHARVVFGRDFAADAMRRDFTINALSADRNGRVHDYAGGLDDLAAGRVRFIGDATRRIREDYLRILRFFRFHASYGEGPLDGDGFAAAIRERAGLEELSRERVRGEILKLLVARRAAEVTAELDAAGFLVSILAGVAQPARLARLASMEAARGVAPDPVLRLAALALMTQDDAPRLRERLRLSNDETGRLVRAVGLLARLHGHAAPEGKALATILFLHRRSATLDALTLAGAGEPAGSPAAAALEKAWGEASEAEEPVLPISGADLLARGLPSGKLIGAALKHLQAAWIRAGFPKDPTEIQRLLDEALARSRAGGP